ncbi:MAG: LamG-like jellyroll fold domain-containing protein [Bacteroidota bacterium]
MYRAFSRFRSLARSSQILLIGLFVFLTMAAFAPIAMLQSGLNTAQPVGTFINGTFPDVTPGQGSGNFIKVDAFPNLTFNLPIHLTEMNGSGRLLVGEMNGRIYSVPNVSTTTTKDLFLDISSRVRFAGESGMLNFALHPRYGIDSNYVYVFYQWNPFNGQIYTRISRFDVINPGANAYADPSSELVLIQQLDRATNHNGGGLFFGTDGFLYISFGDEGPGNNTYNNGQRINDRLMAGVLRIDVDRNPATSHAIRRQPNLLSGSDQSYTANYYVPDSNPWQDVSGGILEEFIAIGFRNPHRMTLDDATGNIWLGDVGGWQFEEIDLILPGHNYQWGFKEGFTGNGPQGPSPPSPFIGTSTDPIYTYPNTGGAAIVGGYVYRGSDHPDLLGKYIFADNGSGRLFSMEFTIGQPPVVTELLDLQFGSSKNGVAGFGVDAANELYILRMNGFGGNGKIYKLDRQNPGAPEPPALLSQTGIFDNMTSLSTFNYVIPYQLNVPFWSDGAIKTRYMVIPNNGTHNTSDEQIGYSPKDPWTFPQGAVLVKHFEMMMDQSNPSITRNLETRFMLHGTDGNYYGVTYKWRDDQSDADLLASNDLDTLQVTTPDGPRDVLWYYPTRGECLSCHNAGRGYVLGPSSQQLNCDMFYSGTGITANQLKSLAHIDIFDTPPDTTNLSALPTASPITNTSLDLTERVLSYLDANCSSCHNPQTGVQALFDARLESPVSLSSLIYGEVLKSLNISEARLIVPQDPEHSVLYQRIASLHDGVAMPPLAKNEIDSVGMNLVKEWIMSLPATSNNGAGSPYIDQRILLSFEEGSGTNTSDQSGNSLNGQLQNGASWTTGYSGSGIAFDGTNDYVSVGANPSLNSGNNITLSAWINPQTLGNNEAIISYGQSGSPYRFTVMANGTLRFGVNNGTVTGGSGGGEWQSTATVNTGQWQHVAVTFDGNELTFYINGIPDNIGSIGPVTIGSINEDLYIGRDDYSGGNYFNGLMDNVRIYHEYLSNVDIYFLSSGYLTAAQQGQAITFDTLPNQAVGIPGFSLTATSSSGLPVTYSIVSGPATLMGDSVVLSGTAGKVTVRAMQAGDASYNEAPYIDRSFWVAPAGSATGTGLTGTYYSNANLTGQLTSRVDPNIDFYWNTDRPINGMGYNSYSVEWEGLIESPTSSPVTFTTNTDDGVRLWVNGNLIIDQWQDQSATIYSATVTLPAWSKVEIKMEYYENRGLSVAQLKWDAQGNGQEIVPQMFLYPDSASVLSAHTIDLVATPQSGRVRLNWEPDEPQAFSYYVLKRAGAREELEELATVPASRKSTYRFVDERALSGMSHYQVIGYNINGAQTASDIQTVFIDPQDQAFKLQVLPNPLADDRMLNLHLYMLDPEPVFVQVLDSRGAIVRQKMLEISDVQTAHQMPLQELSSGVYLVVCKYGGKREIVRIVLP